MTELVRCLATWATSEARPARNSGDNRASTGPPSSPFFSTRNVLTHRQRASPPLSWLMSCGCRRIESRVGVSVSVLVSHARNAQPPCSRKNRSAPAVIAQASLLGPASIRSMTSCLSCPQLGGVKRDPLAACIGLDPTSMLAMELQSGLHLKRGWRRLQISVMHCLLIKEGCAAAVTLNGLQK